MKLLSFEEAIKLSGNIKKHILLGNGFSIAWKPNIFQYSSLFEQADFNTLNPNIKNLFEKLKTKDFELVMKNLIAAAQILGVYDAKNKTLIKQLIEDVQALKSLLVNTIAKNHPETPNEINETEYFRCATFLNRFDSVYSLNYDLLLYWVIMHYNDNNEVRYDDGFRTPETGTVDYVTWEIENTQKQNVFYLHGALHLFDAGAELQKYTWVNTGIKLIDQIRSALGRDFFPLFVSEGISRDKKEKIIHSNYLSRGLRSFASIGGALFIYGHSLAENDMHILRLIPKGKITELYIGIYGDRNSVENKAIISKAMILVGQRNNPKKPLNIEFFDASTAMVWRS